MKVLKVTTNNEISVVEIDKPMLDALHEIVGGFEIVRPRGLSQAFVMIVDDEFLRKEKEFNLIGSILYGYHKHGYPILGDIVIMREVWTSSGRDIMGLEERDIEGLATYLSTIPEQHAAVTYDCGEEIISMITVSL